jgi:hypothetical protein
MIVWPDEDVVRDSGRYGLRRFRESGACAALEDDAATWRVVSWPWTDEPPIRVVLENESHDAVVFTLREGGIWQLEGAPLAMHARSADALATDARGEPGEGPLQPGHHM